jgi:purine-binding chemotaxis protein CheW
MSNFDELNKELDEDTLKNRFLTFLIDKETFGIEIRYVMEIIGIQAITEMPEMPDYIKGIINLRGRIIPVMDVRLRFRKNPRDYDDRTCVIVTDFDGVWVGLVVDSVSEVLTIDEADISERPNIASGDSRGYVRNIGKKDGHVILLLDCGRLLSGEELDGLGMIS